MCSRRPSARPSDTATSIGTEHLLLGLLAEPDGIAARVLIELGDAAAGVREIIASDGDNGSSSRAT